MTKKNHGWIYFLESGWLEFQRSSPLVRKNMLPITGEKELPRLVSWELRFVTSSHTWVARTETLKLGYPTSITHRAVSCSRQNSL